ncbi:hypothetical protein C8Q78DRAFT_1074995 [Trametes maxima]|nr:hypothetical protein C8Q78DRAFT_1074995 [Trametes maxima]
MSREMGYKAVAFMLHWDAAEYPIPSFFVPLVLMAKSQRRKGVSRQVKQTIVDSSSSAASSTIKVKVLKQQAIAKEREAAKKRIHDSLIGGHTLKQLQEMRVNSGIFEDFPQDLYQGASMCELQDVGDAMEVDGVLDDGESLVHALRDLLKKPGNLRYKYRDARTWRQRLEKADTYWTSVLDEVVSSYLCWKHPSRPSDSPPMPASTSSCTHEGADPSSFGPRGNPPSAEPSAASSARVGVITNPSDFALPPPPLPGSPQPRHGATLRSTASSPRGVARDAHKEPTRTHATRANDPVSSGSPEDMPPPREDHTDASCNRDTSYNFSIDVVDIYTLQTTVTISRTGSQTAVVALAEQGYMATTPISPSLAISFRTLELFRLIRLRKPSFSTEAFAKLVCDCYALPYRRRYRSALSDSLDIYLNILRVIEKRVTAALERDTPDWRVLNACPACCYKVEDEPELIFERMFSMDGNNSLKRIIKIGDRETAQRRVFSESDYYLPTDFVDRYKDEVKHTPQAPAQTPGSDSEDDDWIDEGEATAADFEGADDKAAENDTKKKMWGIFDETGIFASACRHGFILWITDMVRSGELAKYPLAIVAKALDTLGRRLLIGYDIGCTFGGTISRSSLGPEFRVIAGTGIEDLGGMERIFSSSNQLASVVRYASKYLRRLLIDMYFKQWDEDKYLNLGTMLLQNYRQAIEIIQDKTPILQENLRNLGCTLDDLAKWREEEVSYFANLSEESPWDVHAVEYVSLLRRLRELEDRSRSNMDVFMTSIPDDYTFTPPDPTASKPSAGYYADASATKRRETERRAVREEIQDLRREVIALELHMGISTRWQPHSQEYIDTMQYIHERDYRVALDNVQRLVVQRLFELHTMNLLQTAYKVRTHIAKNLQRRSKAIRTAIRTYNKAALALDPPRPTLDWSKITHYAFIEEFELLRDTRNSLAGKRWAEASVRETMKLHGKISHAHEEIRRCNIEVCRVHTSIIDEDHVLDETVARYMNADDPLAGALADFRLRRTLAQAFRDEGEEAHWEEPAEQNHRGG